MKGLLKICRLNLKEQEEVIDYDLHRFLSKNLPIFWIMGPPNCGKSTLADMLAKSSKYQLLKISSLLREESVKGRWRGKMISQYMSKGRWVPDNIVVNLVKEILIRSCDYCTGYILDGFPVHVKQAKLFEKKICKVNVIIYTTLILDALLARRITQIGMFDPDVERVNHIRHSKCLNKVARRYEQKTIKLHANYPPENTCTQLVEDLEDFWGYKFLHLYTKNQ